MPRPRKAQQRVTDGCEAQDGGVLDNGEGHSSIPEVQVLRLQGELGQRRAGTGIVLLLIREQVGEACAAPRTDPAERDGPRFEQLPEVRARYVEQVGCKVSEHLDEQVDHILRHDDGVPLTARSFGRRTLLFDLIYRVDIPSLCDDVNRTSNPGIARTAADTRL